MVNSKVIREALVYYEEGNESRWIDAVGNNVVKRILAPGMASNDAAPYKPTSLITTVTETGAGSCTIVPSATAGEVLVLTTDDAEYEGLNVQLRGEAFKISTGKPFYFGIKCKISDATQSDLLVGMCQLKTDLLKTAAAHGVTAAAVEGLFFLKADAATTIKAKGYLVGVEVLTANAATVEDTAMHIYEIYYDGATVYWYLDGLLVTSLAASLPTEDLTPSINVRAGENAAKVLRIAWMKAIQIN